MDRLYRASGIRVALVRHGNTTRPDPALSPLAGDLGRVLTERGTQQALLARRTWFQRLLQPRLAPFFVTSRAARCRQTASLLLTGQPWQQQQQQQPQSSHNECKELVSGTLYPDNQPVGERLFAKLSYNPLRRFWAEQGGREAFDAYARTAADEIEALIEGAITSGGNDRVVLVFSHAVYISALAHEVAQRVGLAAPHLDTIADRFVGEVEGFLIEADGVHCFDTDLPRDDNPGA